jgi:hypothetical protein
MFTLPALLLGLLGSLHCVGMCGPIALALPVGTLSGYRKIPGILSYNSGRIFTYAALGMIAGFTGQTVKWAIGQQALSIMAGSFILLFIIAGAIGKKLPSVKLFPKFFSALRNKLGILFRKKSLSSFFLIGLLNGMLPCGLVYAAIAGAVSSGSFIGGAAFMTLFGLGTVPALFSLSFLESKINFSARSKIKKAVPVLVGVMAVLLIIRGLGLGIPYLSPSMQSGVPYCPHCHR